MDHKTTLGRPLSVVAVRPHPRPMIKVRGVKFAAIRILPKPHRAGRKRLGTDQFTLLTLNRVTRFIPDSGGHAQAGGLKLAGVDRERGHPAGETRDDVGAARDAGQVQVRLEGTIHPLKTLMGQRRPCRQHGRQRAQFVAVSGENA